MNNQLSNTLDNQLSNTLNNQLSNTLKNLSESQTLAMTRLSRELIAEVKDGFDDEQIKQMLGIKTYGRCGIRTHDPFRVKEVRYHCANRPHNSILNHCLLSLRTEEMVVVRRVKT